MKYKILIKAWCIDFSKVEDGYLYTEKIAYAQTRSTARKLLLNECRYDDIKLLRNKSELTYLNIPVKRHPDSDKVEYKGKAIIRFQIARQEWLELRNAEFQTLLSYPAITHCYIMKRGSYYRPNSSGYTAIKAFAGIYPKHEAVPHARSCDEITLIPINNAEHNSMLQKTMNEMSKRIIIEPNAQNFKIILEFENVRVIKYPANVIDLRGHTEVVINLSDEHPIEYAQYAILNGILPYWFPMGENAGDMGMASMFGALGVLHQCKQKSFRAIVHCHASINRAPTLLAAYAFMQTSQHLPVADNQMLFNCNNGYLPALPAMEAWLMACKQVFDHPKQYYGGAYDYTIVQMQKAIQ